MPSSFKLVWSSFFFCHLNSLFQVEVFEAIQDILTSQAGWKIPKRVNMLNMVIQNSQAGINTTVESQKRAIFVKAWDALHDWKKS